jgi:hypothetical protein
MKLKGPPSRHPSFLRIKRSEIDDNSVLKIVNNLQNQLNNFIKRRGTFEYPALTCQDLSTVIDIKNDSTGYYQLDTNSGSFYDQFTAECQFSLEGEAKTCIALISQPNKVIKLITLLENEY